jgi:hypothetical protein
VVDSIIKGNIIENNYNAWIASTVYKVDDQVLIGTHVYKCITAGTSGTVAFAHSATGNITDGTCTWVYAKELGIRAVSYDGISNVFYEQNTISNFSEGIYSNPTQTHSFKGNSYINVTTPYNDTSKDTKIIEGIGTKIMDLDFVRGDASPFTNNLANITATQTTDATDTYLRLQSAAADLTPYFKIKATKTSRDAYFLIEVLGRTNNVSNEIIFTLDGAFKNRPKFTTSFTNVKTLIKVNAGQLFNALFHLLVSGDYIDIKNIRITMFEQ